MKLFVKSERTFNELAALVKQECLPDYGMELRDGLNLGGGEYFKFSHAQSEILFVQNHSEVFVESMKDFPFYFYILKGSTAPLKPLHKSISDLEFVCVLSAED
ncbi:MAG: hypothetical protein HXX12_16730 [Geothrix sp.]|uniref:hypothetical protein n=1 Tax=Geothrix sp. TaxID=1962974 RepID=UPI0017CB726D|nr:hypothetical protein [Geothrix sp.]NWJ42609.1 hypothetical protein [Geothrix sp.]WIL21375.1 MAG: hypothetical protein QOZ81_000634 [Geothrix sp.]